MRRRSGLGAAVLLAGAAIAGQAQAAAPYDIDAVLSLTGGGAFLGQLQQRSLQILEGVVNEEGGIGGRPLHFVFSDDQTSPQIAVQLGARIVADRPAVVLGPGLVATCNAFDALTKDGPVAYCLSPGIHPAAGGYMIAGNVSTRDNLEALVRYFRLRGRTRLAFIFSTDATGREAESDLEAVLRLPENSTIERVALEHFTPGDVSAAAQMERIKAAAPQALFAWSTGAAVATLFKGIVQAGLDVPVTTTNGNQTYRQMTQYADFLPKELYLPSSLWPAAQQGVAASPAVEAAQRRFLAAYKAAGIDPDSASVLPWDPAMIVVDGLRKLGPGATAEQLRGFIAHLRAFGGINGIYDFEKTPQRGLGIDDLLITRWTPAEHIWKVVSKPTGIPLD